jgi:hypothetical protein
VRDEKQFSALLTHRSELQPGTALSGPGLLKSRANSQVWTGSGNGSLITATHYLSNGSSPSGKKSIRLEEENIFHYRRSAKRPAAACCK